MQLTPTDDPFRTALEAKDLLAGEPMTHRLMGVQVEETEDDNDKDKSTAMIVQVERVSCSRRRTRAAAVAGRGESGVTLLL